MEEKSKSYTAADFARYHAGTMPPREMHELEKAALEDPFLDDALGGYLHSLDAEGDSEDLKRRLAEKRKKKSVFFISSLAQNKWWRIAALFIIMAGAGYFFYRLNFMNQEKPLAKNETQGPVNKTDSTVVMKDEAKTKTNDTASDHDIAFQNQLSKSPEKEKRVLPGTGMGDYKSMITPAKKPSPQIAADAYESQPKAALDTLGNYDKKTEAARAAIPLNQYTLKGKVTDENGNALPYAYIMDKARQNGTVTDSAGYFLLHSKDSSINATASAVGYESKNFSLKKDAPSLIAMNKSNSALEEVVVSAYGARKRKQEKVTSTETKTLNSKIAGANISNAAPQPFPENDTFNQYIQKNIKPLYDENNDRVTGVITLSFTINKKGRPRNVKVIKSTCETCEDEAIRLLENGPNWIWKNDAPGTVEITF